jgi:hypothetical protein
MAVLNARDARLDGRERFQMTQAQRTKALVDRVIKEGFVEIDGSEEVSMWLLYSADSKIRPIPRGGRRPWPNGEGVKVRREERKV